MDEDVFLGLPASSSYYSRTRPSGHVPRYTYTTGLVASTPLAAVSTSIANMVAVVCHFPTSSGKIIMLSCDTSSIGTLAGRISTINCSDGSFAAEPTIKRPSLSAPPAWRHLVQDNNPTKNTSTLSTSNPTRIETPTIIEWRIENDLIGTSGICTPTPAAVSLDPSPSIVTVVPRDSSLVTP